PESFRSANFMIEGKAKKSKPNPWQTIRQAWGPYKRLYAYVLPYKWRFILGLAFGVAFGFVNSLFPVAVGRVTSFVFHGSASSLSALRQHPDLLSHGEKINSIIAICLSIPAIMTVRSLFDYLNTYYMQWVSNKVVTDIRSQLFNKM